MSSACVRIEAYCHQSFSERRPVPTVAPWLQTYYDGLLQPFEMQTDMSRLDNGRNNDFLSMASSAMNRLKSVSPLDDIGLLLMAHQTLDTYFPFRSTTTLLCRAFDINAPAIGMTEQELTSPYIALTSLLAALRQESFVGTGLLVVLDQASLPYQRPGSTPDDIDNTLVMKLTASPDGAGTRVTTKRYWTEERSRNDSWVTRCIYDYLDSQRIALESLHIVIDASLVASEIESFPALKSHADPRLMSSSGLVAAMNLLVGGTPLVLLPHLSNDGHLYLFLFDGRTQTDSKQGAPCSI